MEPDILNAEVGPMVVITWISLSMDNRSISAAIGMAGMALSFFSCRASVNPQFQLQGAF